MAFVKMSNQAMSVIQKATAKGMSKSGKPATMERNVKIGHQSDPHKKAPKMVGKPTPPTPMAPKKSKVTKQLKGPVGGYPKVHDPEGMF